MPRRLKILEHPNPALRQKAPDLDVSKINSPDFQSWLDDLTVTMELADGIGLAATQVGQPLAAAVIMSEHGPFHLINPKIIFYGKKKESAEEGCLSVPGVAGLVRRSQEIKVTALDRRGRPIEFGARELLARVIQHEVDHLNGLLFIDRAEKIWQVEKKEKLLA